MLYDRFDDMRSKGITGGGDGFDLTKIGTTVSVQAQSSIAKGAKWQGVKNTSASLSLQENAMPSLKSISPLDLSYTFTRIYSPFSSSVHLFTMYFFDTQSNQYVRHDVELQSILDTFNLDSSKTYAWHAVPNEDGTLIALTWLEMYDTSGSFTGASKIIIIEVDKENKTTTPYVFTLPFTFKRIENNVLISNNNIFLRDYVSSSSHRLAYYRYDKESHNLSLVRSTSWNNSAQDSLYACTSFVSKNNVILASGGNLLIKIAMFESSYSFNFTAMQSPFSYLLGLDNNMEYIIGGSALDSANATMYVVPLNLNDLTFGTPISLLNVRTSTKAFMYNNRILMYNKIYSFDGSSITEVLSSTDTHLSDINSLSWNGKKWAYFYQSNSNSNKIFIILDSSGEYLIEPYTQIATSSDKYYGIASNNIALGDNGFAQLLFNTIS